MGSYVADQVSKLMTKKCIHVVDANILAATHKEKLNGKRYPIEIRRMSHLQCLFHFSHRIKV